MFSDALSQISYSNQLALMSLGLRLWALFRCVAGLFHALAVQPREIFSPVYRALRVGGKRPSSWFQDYIPLFVLVSSK